MRIYLHAGHDGEVWRSQYGIAPTHTYVHDLDKLELPRTGVVYVIGAQCNAQLIAGLYTALRDESIGALYVCSPVGCTRQMLWHDPGGCLAFARKLAQPASLGGFHAVTTDDYIIYALAGVDPASRTCTAKMHAMWPHAAFGCADEDKLAGLMHLITDPRWYVSTHKPNSYDRLYAWLGLDPHTQSGVLYGRKRGRYHSRCRLVLGTWWPRSLLSLDELCRSGQTILPVNAAASLPGAFAYRRWAGEYMSRELVASVVRASKYFIRYLCLGWAATWAEHPEFVFSPEQFFGAGDIACKYYERHVNA